MKDYIIVGAGIAGISFAETAFLNNKSFVVFNDTSQQSTRVAAGLYNPVILKRMSLPLNAAEHMEYIRPFYKRIEERLNIKFDHQLPVLRKFASVEEQNNWFEAMDKPAFIPFLSTKIVRNKYDSLDAPFGFGEVLGTGYVDTVTFLKAYHEYLAEKGNLINDSFIHEDLVVNKNSVAYKGTEARHILFAEGFGLHQNHFFKHLPLGGTKGELLLIKAPALKLDAAVNSGIFILPMGDDLYKVGATYEWDDKTSVPTDAAKQELITKLEEIISCKYEIIDHFAGIRPTVKDRKALIGTHPDYNNVHLLNGLGTRGIMLGPPMANALFESIENGSAIDKAVDLRRFIR